MNRAKKRNTAHSVFQRLLSHAKTRGQDFNLLLFRYERKQVQWRAFVRKSKPEHVSGDIDAVIGEVVAFLMPVMKAVRQDERLDLFWPQGGPWRKVNKD